MAFPTRSSPLLVTQVGSVTAARMVHPVILSGETAEVVGEHLSRLAESGHTRIVLNCANVQSVTSMIIGKFIALHKQLVAAGGGLALCEATPDVREVFEVVGLPQVVPIYPQEQAAVERLGR
jgi:anti-anti-sigma factor